MVERLRGVIYNDKETGRRQVGVIAEEVGEVLPEIVEWEENGTDARGVDYARLVAVLLEAVKEQQQHIAKQEQQIEVLHQQLRSVTTGLARRSSGDRPRTAAQGGAR